ncbi:hypothetical protein GCK32_020346, partial [Trichostrongylus colubriformis]
FATFPNMAMNLLTKGYERNPVATANLIHFLLLARSQELRRLMEPPLQGHFRARNLEVTYFVVFAVKS